MKLGIVGSEAAKFTPITKKLACDEIAYLVRDADLVISGHSPLGGIDIWAVQVARHYGVAVQEYPPRNLSWRDGYRERNLQIANGSDKVVCITVKELPEGYQGMRFPGGCYHCGTPAEHHVKSGGCWTMKRAKLAGKDTQLIVIEAPA